MFLHGCHLVSFTGTNIHSLALKLNGAVTEVGLLASDTGSNFFPKQLILSAFLFLSLQALTMAPIQATYVPHLDVLQQVMIVTMNDYCRGDVLHVVNSTEPE